MSYEIHIFSYGGHSLFKDMSFKKACLQVGVFDRTMCLIGIYVHVKDQRRPFPDDLGDARGPET